MTFEQAAQIMMNGGKTQELSITENGTYKPPEGVVGYSKVVANIPDRYSEGYDAGKKEGAIRATADFYQRVKSKTITENGTYNATQETIEIGGQTDNLKAYNPVIVNVPDRYDEGYADGRKAGYDEGYKVGYDDGQADKPGYTFPDGTSYEDIYKFIGGAGTITDVTMNGYIKKTISPYSSKDGTTVTVYFYASNGYRYSLGGGGYGPGATDVKIDYVYIDPVTGEYDTAISYVWSGERTVGHKKGQRDQLIGFGSADHEIRVAN